MNDEQFYMQILFLGTSMSCNLKHMQLIESGFQFPLKNLKLKNTLLPNQITKCLKKKTPRLPSWLTLVLTWLANNAKFDETATQILLSTCKLDCVLNISHQWTLGEHTTLQNMWSLDHLKTPKVGKKVSLRKHQSILPQICSLETV